MSPLTGFQVVELTTGVAGPMVGMLLADFGANVVKVEPPGGDPTRGTPEFVGLNRGKSSLIIDTASEKDSRLLLDRLLSADICVVKDAASLRAYGIDVDTLRQENPRLVLVELPPYSPGGETPWLGGHESHGLLTAHSGLSWRQASFDGNPVEWVRPQFLYAQAIWGATCVVAALTEREVSGCGQRVEVSAMNGLMVMSAGVLTTFTDAADPNTALGVAGRHPTYSRFQAGDGQWLSVGGLGPKFEPILLECLGLSHVLDDPRVGHLSKLLEPSNYGWISELIRKAFTARGRDEWLDTLERLGIPCGPIEASDKWLDNPQVEAIGMHARVEDAEFGTVSLPGVPIQLDRSPGAVRSAAPALGEQAATWSDAVSGTEAPQGEPPVRPGPLSGFTILDMGTFVAGPYTGSLLAELGADVIKVEPASGDPFRQSGFTYNRGMRSFAVNLKNPEGVAALHAVVKECDAIVSSNRPGTAEALGIDYDTLVGLNPRIISLTLSGFGEQGPLAGRPGVDLVLQGMSGMMTNQGGDSDPVCNTLASIDTGSGAIGALGVTLALLHRERTGEGQRGAYSLAATATLLQLCELVRYSGRPPAVTGGRDFKGPHPLDRFYETSDGWIRLQALTDDLDLGRLVALGKREAEDGSSPKQLAGILADRLGDMVAADAVQWLQGMGIPAVVARKVSDAQRDESLLEGEFVHARPAAGGRNMYAPGRLARFSRTQRRGPMLVAGVGESTVSILKDAGLTESRIASLIADKVVVQGEPAPQTLAYIYR